MSETEAAAAAVVVAMACIPDVIISNILERVPDLVSLFRCSLVCKEWRGIVADPAFLRRRGIWPKPEVGQSQTQSSSSLVGIFVQRDRPLRGNSRPRKISKRFPTRAPALVPAPGSLLGPQLRFLTSFVRGDAGGDGILDDATPLAARDGLLLVRIWRPRSSTDKNSGSVVVLRLCVCNLLTGRRDLLPAFDVHGTFDSEGVRGYALLTAADNNGAFGLHDGRCPADGYSTLFQVLLVGRGHAEHLVHRFSSASGDWDALDCSQAISGVQDPHGVWGPHGCRVAAVARGTAHWFFGGDAPSPSFYTLNVSAGTGRVSMTALPVDAGAAIVRVPYKAWWLCTSAKGSLALLCVNGNNRLVMMKQRQRDDGDHHWDSSHVAEVDLDVELGFGHESLSPVCIGDRSGTALALYRSDPECAYVLDLESGSATKLEGWIRSFNYMTAVPCEINWEMFFVSRLGVKALAS